MNNIYEFMPNLKKEFFLCDKNKRYIIIFFNKKKRGYNFRLDNKYLNYDLKSIPRDIIVAYRKSGKVINLYLKNENKH